MSMNTDKIKKLVRSIMTTSDDEIGCTECFDHLDNFVELHLQGVDPVQALPLVQAHLNRCKNCHEEFEALITAIKAIS